ncbi:MAG: hypothetical protein ACLTDX_17610 [[Clostridium] innocuum]
MEKKQTRKEQALQTRSNILTVCTGLLREHTFDELSISMICRKRTYPWVPSIIILKRNPTSLWSCTAMWMMSS